MKYPTFRIRGTPTPNEKLIVCDECQIAAWVAYSVGVINYCCGRRMRVATIQERDAAAAALKTIL
jgi:hypothetical protein